MSYSDAAVPTHQDIDAEHCLELELPSLPSCAVIFFINKPNVNAAVCSQALLYLLPINGL